MSIDKIWKDEIKHCGHTILYSGQNTNHVNGVAIIISKEVEKTLLQWQPVNDRLITARFDSKFCKLTLMQCYAPTNDADEELKNELYDQLQAVFDGVPQHDMVLITGDLNAKKKLKIPIKSMLLGNMAVALEMKMVKSSLTFV